MVIGNIDAADNVSIDLLYHVPFWDIYVRSSEYIVGGTAPPPTDKIHAQLEAVPTTSESNKLIMSQFKLKVMQNFQMDSSVFQIINISGDNVSAICVYGATKGASRHFNASDVLRSTLEQLLDILMHRMF